MAACLLLSLVIPAIELPWVSRDVPPRGCEEKVMNRAFALSFVLAFAGLPTVAQDRRPSHERVKYGPHERNVLDVWLAKSDRPTPVLVSIHGGGFAKGDKSVSPDLLRRCLDSGISVAAITYRFSNQEIGRAHV